MSLGSLLGSSPDLAVLVCALGVVLIYLEFNRPGLILPGAIGLLLLLLGLAAIAQHPMDVPAGLCLLASAMALLWGLRRRTHWLLAAAATIGIVLGCRNLVATGPRVHLLTAAAAGLILGPGTFLLTAIARRARVNKGLD